MTIMSPNNHPWFRRNKNIIVDKMIIVFQEAIIILTKIPLSNSISYGRILCVYMFELFSSIKRAFSGCLGNQRRWRTWQAAISSGKVSTTVDPEISEWGNPSFKDILRWIHRRKKLTRGSETSQYPEEKKSTEIPKVAASEIGPGQWPYLNN